MSGKLDKEHFHELLRMIKEKSPGESSEKILAIFCERHGLSQDECRHYYDILVAEGNIKEK